MAFWEANNQQVRLQQLQKGPFDLLIAGRQIDESRIYYVESNSSYRVKTCLTGNYISLALVLGGTYTMEWAGRQETGLPGAMFLAVPGTEFAYVAQKVRGIVARVGLYDLNRIRTKSLPHAKRTQLNRFLPAEVATDLTHLLKFLVSEIERYGPDDGPLPIQLKLITKAISNRVSAHITESLGPLAEFFSIRELSAAVGWSERQIYRAFEGVCNCTPAEFIRRSKLIRARGLMWNSHLPAITTAELSRQIGYRNV